VVGAFDVPFGHFAFDDAWCRPCPPAGVEAPQHPCEKGVPAVIVVFLLVRGETRPGGRRSVG